MLLKTEWTKQGFIDEPVAEGTDLKAEIRKLCNFAPDLEIVENYRTCLIFNKKELTAVVHNVKPHGYN